MKSMTYIITLCYLCGELDSRQITVTISHYTPSIMYITACKENDNVSLVEDDFIEADRIEGHDRDDDQKYEFYKKFLQDTEKNFNNTQNESVIDGQIRFLELQERLIKSLKNNIQPTDYVICQELECPVCLTEMLPPTKIWNCKSGE